MTRLVIDASALLSGIASNPEKPPGMLIAALYRGDHPGLHPPALTVRATCEMLGLL